MLNKVGVAAFVALVLSVGPLVAFAQTPGDIDPNENTSSCVDLKMDLRYRMADAQTGRFEVSLLQDFLQSAGYLNSEPTGFLGLLTQAAAKKYQSSVGLSPTGFVGPLTRAKIKASTCGEIIAKNSFSASPTSGTMPLTVNFTLTFANSCSVAIEKVVRLEYGDGTSEERITHCGTQTTKHTYKRTGSYTASLKIADYGPSPLSYEKVGDIAIRVNKREPPPAPFSLSISPTSGIVPLTVTFKGSGGGTSYFGGVTIDFGDGSTATFCSPGRACGRKTVDHTYTASGTYTAKFIGIGEGTRFDLGSATIVVQGGSTAALTASPTSGTAPLAVIFRVSNNEGKNLQIDFGDGSTGPVHDSIGCVLGGACYTDRGAYHLYTSSGTYTARLMTCSSSGLCAPLTGIQGARAGTVTITVQSSASTGLSASPTSGQVPLAVSFIGNTGSGCGGGNFTLSYGDGTSDELQVPADSCNPTIRTTHTYSAAGTYLAQLSSNICGAAAAAQGCLAPTQLLGSAEVIVTGAVEMCLYAAPPPGCTFIEGPNYNPVTSCGLMLQCTDGSASALNAFNAASPASSPVALVTTAPNFSHTFSLDLYRGTEGIEVRALQEALKAEGLFNGEVSGNFYDQTREAVLKFQRKYGINATGYVGAATRAKLNELYSK